MRRLLLVVVFCLVWAGGSPIRAQEAFVGVFAGQYACAFFEDELDDGSILIGDVCGARAAGVTLDGPALVDGCAGMILIPPEDSGDPVLLDQGCGQLTVEVDPLLASATISGTLATTVFNFTTEEETDSTLVIDVTATGEGDTFAGAGQGAGVLVTPFVAAGAGAGAGMERFAPSDGTLESAVLGELGGPGFGFIGQALDVFVELIIVP